VTTFPVRTTGFPARTTGTTAGRPPRTGARPVSAWAFAGVAVTSFGGPLALAALNVPGIVAGSAAASAGRRVALVQAGLWIVSYLLYLLYTTTQVVYDTLPPCCPASGGTSPCWRSPSRSRWPA
jgi:hypothetical protein